MSNLLFDMRYADDISDCCWSIVYTNEYLGGLFQLVTMTMTMKYIYFDTTRATNHNMAIENEYKKCYVKEITLKQNICR